MWTSMMPTVMASASGFGYQVEQEPQDGQARPQEHRVITHPDFHETVLKINLKSYLYVLKLG
jgi:hypothetical protein